MEMTLTMVLGALYMGEIQVMTAEQMGLEIFKRMQKGEDREKILVPRPAREQ